MSGAEWGIVYFAECVRLHRLELIFQVYFFLEFLNKSWLTGVEI